MNYEEKVKHAEEIIRDAVNIYSPKIAVACSFGKDSMVVTHLAKKVDPKINVFSIMTMYKPKETFEYLRIVNKEMGLNTTVYMVDDKIPETLKDPSLEVRLLPQEEFDRVSSRIEKETGKKIYEINPDQCCMFLKVEPTKKAVENLDAWICGLRSTEGRTRKNFQEKEKMGGLVKINPILMFTEEDVWRYIETNNIPVHIWYKKGYRSLGCAPCSNPGGELERDGRWKGTSKCGGECGIHSKCLKG